MGHLPKILNTKIIRKLDEKGKIICFNYFEPELSKAIKEHCSEEEAQRLIKYDCSPQETSHAIINGDLYSKVYCNDKIKILEKYPETLEINLDQKNNQIKLSMRCAYVPKGSQYILVKRNFQKDYSKI